jgi:putative membrane protein
MRLRDKKSSPQSNCGSTLFGFPFKREDLAGAPMSSLFAFLHHMAAFALVAALAVEFVLIKETITETIARKLLLADLVFGVSAGAVLVIGLLRVFFFEKPAVFYFANIPFLAKLALFALIGIMSIRPTRQFLSWRTPLKAGQAPTVDVGTLRKLRKTIHMELAALALLILCAALMARGVGNLG